MPLSYRCPLHFHANPRRAWLHGNGRDGLHHVCLPRLSAVAARSQRAVGATCSLFQLRSARPTRLPVRHLSRSRSCHRDGM